MFYYYYRVVGDYLLLYTDQGLKKVKCTESEFLKKDTHFEVINPKICNLTVHNKDLIARDLLTGESIEELKDYCLITGFELSKYNTHIDLKDKLCIDYQFVYKHFLKKTELFRNICLEEFGEIREKNALNIVDVVERVEKKYNFFQYILSRANKFNCNFHDIFSPNAFMEKKINKNNFTLNDKYSGTYKTEEIVGGYFKFTNEAFVKGVVVGDFVSDYPSHIKGLGISLDRENKILPNIVDELKESILGC
jgi:hypothetical protein